MSWYSQNSIRRYTLFRWSLILSRLPDSFSGVCSLIQQVCRLSKGLRLLNLSKTSLSSKGGRFIQFYKYITLENMSSNSAIGICYALRKSGSVVQPKVGVASFSTSATSLVFQSGSTSLPSHVIRKKKTTFINNKISVSFWDLYQSLR